VLSLEKCNEYLKELNLTKEETIKLRTYFEYIAKQIIKNVTERNQIKAEQ
jgi:hypothetical protein